MKLTCPLLKMSSVKMQEKMSYLINDHGRFRHYHISPKESGLLNLRGKIDGTCVFMYFFLDHWRMVIFYTVQHQSVFLALIIISISYVGLHSLNYMRIPMFIVNTLCL